MRALGRAFAVFVIFAFTSVAWLVLGGVTSHRSREQSGALQSEVHHLWGRPHVQQSPRLTVVGGPNNRFLAPSSTDIAVDLKLDQRMKGLTWYSLYDVVFDASWTYTYEGEERATLHVDPLPLPDPQGVYDGYRFSVNGEDVPLATGGILVDVSPGDVVTLAAAYKSRGLGSWQYASREGAASLRDFRLDMTTNFDAIDFPERTLSPSIKEDREGGGKHLVWDFEQVVSGHGIGMVMPERTQPGELASNLSFSAPISLLFFFLVIAVLAKLRGLEIHPVNYFFLGAGFFSFHLLFAYTVDHLSLPMAFALSSVTSVAMVTAYLRLVVSARFALVESGIAQLVYLVGFSLAHFWKGMTGLTVTVLSIGTLFVLMLLTGRIRWSEVIGKVAPATPTQPFHGYPVYQAAHFPQPVPPQAPVDDLAR